MELTSIVSSWLCSTGVAVISCYCILTHHANTPAEQKKATEVATRITKRGLIPEYKPKNRHSSAVRKMTVAKVAAKDASALGWRSAVGVKRWYNSHHLKEGRKDG